MQPDITLGRHILLPHPVSTPGALQDLVHELSVSVVRAQADQLNLTYRLSADLDALRLPEPRPPVRTDGLWRHTCFEAFIGHCGASDYWEFNFSPSGAWAAYHFSAYREGMAPLLKGAPPAITPRIGVESVELSVMLDLSWLVRSAAGVGLRLGLAAVVEDKARVLSYWALKHPAEKPDFHHADSFVVELD
ncbi:MAG TPA: DOMON-like domain-containing protein [Steroidobacteraceae bacterium]|nr:DOMON-like domain-containing protein [Steroidobacteraceae bacterium]